MQFDMSDSMKPKLIYILDDNRYDVKRLDARLKKEKRKFVKVRPLSYFLS